MFKSLISLIASNLLSRGFYSIAIIIFAETYSAEIFSEIIFIATALIFFATVAPLRFELAILEAGELDKKISSFFIYAVSISLIIFFVIFFIDAKISIVLIFFSLYANIGTILMVSKGLENILLKVRTISSIIGLLFLAYSFINDLDSKLALFLIMSCYFSTALLPFIYSRLNISLRKSIAILKAHIRIYYPQIIETIFITMSNMALILLLKNKLIPIDYQNVSIASQLFISSAILVGSSLSYKYLNLLNKNTNIVDFFASYKKIIVMALFLYIFIIITSNIFLKNGYSFVTFHAISEYYYFILLSFIYLLVVPFSSIMVFNRKLKLNAVIHIAGSIIRITPLLIIGNEQAIIFYIGISIIFYIAYGLIIARQHSWI